LPSNYAMLQVSGAKLYSAGPIAVLAVQSYFLPRHCIFTAEIKPTGILLHDFVVRCAALGVWPHPSLLRTCTAAITATASGYATATATATATAASARPLVVYPPLEEPVLPPFALPPLAAHLGVAQVDQLPAAALSTLSLGAYQWDTGAVRALAWALPACRTLVNVRYAQKLATPPVSLRTWPPRIESRCDPSAR
jgi:hypothetical protein